ncbi:MAG: AraC family transcriptional regulator [Pseudomonadales bacterium]
MKKRHAAFYHKCFERVINHIYAHLDQPLDLYRLAEVACLSPHHWHRIYQGVYGETVAATVRRLRLHRAAGELSSGNQTIASIAKRSGYASVASFSRAFTSEYTMPPARFRASGQHTHFRIAAAAQLQGEQEHMHQIEIQHQQALDLIGLVHTGPYMEIGSAFEKLFAWCSINGHFAQVKRTVGVYLDDPTAVEPAQLRSVAAVAGPAVDELPQGYTRLTLAAGEYAVLQFRGPYAGLHVAYEWLYGTWLPNSGRIPDNQPVYEEYLNDPRETAPEDLLTNIYVPLQA